MSLFACMVIFELSRNKDIRHEILDIKINYNNSPEYQSNLINYLKDRRYKYFLDITIITYDLYSLKCLINLGLESTPEIDLVIVFSRDFDMAKFLVSHYNLNLKDLMKNGDTYLHRLAKISWPISPLQNNIVSSIKYLLLNGVDKKLRDFYGYTAYDYANSVKANQEILNLLNPNN